MDESREQIPIIAKETDPNALKIDRLILEGDRELCLIGLDHHPLKMPKENPWPAVENEIADSSLVFVEYAYPELLQLENHPLLGEEVKEESKKKGIDVFARKTAALIQKHGKEMAVADIANSVTYEAGYYMGAKFLPLLGILAGIALEKPEIIAPAFVGNLYSGFMILQEQLGIGVFGKNAHLWEEGIVDAEDARRLITSRGLEQELKRLKPGSKATYISPPHHTSRVKFYHEHRTDPLVKAKEKLWSLAAGLDKSVRIYKYSPRYNSWLRSSNVPIKL